MSVVKEITEFALASINPAVRIQLHKSKFYPIVEGILVVVDRDASIRGARVFFEPPVEASWVTPELVASTGSYDNAREQQSPLTSTFYLFTGDAIDKCTEALIYANPA